MDDQDVNLVSDRSCDGCTVCCKLLSISALNKPRQVWCKECDTGVGCKIYSSRPTECASFYCNFLLDDQIGEEWDPIRCRMVLTFEQESNRIVIHVDHGRKNAWRTEPFFSQIKEWARNAAEHRGQVVVWQGLDAIVVFPNTEKNIGRVRSDQSILTLERNTPSGIAFDAIVVDSDDPRLGFV